jgi:hypothetical protein
MAADHENDVEDPAAFSARVLAVRDELAPLLPDIDPGDLLVILHSMLRPLGTGCRFLLREISPGVHVA